MLTEEMFLEKEGKGKTVHPLNSKNKCVTEHLCPPSLIKGKIISTRKKTHMVTTSLIIVFNNINWEQPEYRPSKLMES